MAVDHHLVFVNEFTLWRLLWLTWRNRSVYVLEAQSELRVFQGVIDKIVASLRARGKIGDDRRSWATMKRFSEFPQAWRMTPIYEQIEPAIEEYFEYENLVAAGYKNAFPFKATTANYFQRPLKFLHFLHEFASEVDAAKFEIIGMPAELGYFYEVCYGEPTPYQWRPASMPRALINAYLALLTSAFTIVWLIRKTVLRLPPPRPVKLGIDGIGDVRHLQMVKEILDDPSDGLVVHRSIEDAEFSGDMFSEFPECLVTDGAFSVLEALQRCRDAILDGIDCWRRFRGIEPVHFFDVSKFSFYTATFAGLMNRYEFAYFIGRDDYSQQHIFRTWELRRRGGVSFGKDHGMCWGIEPVWRYIDFDTYYVYGTEYMERRYVSRWSKQMKLKAVGIFGMSRQQLAKIDLPRPHDFIVFYKPWIDGLDFLEQISKLKRRFPDRKIYVKHKPRSFSKYDHDEYLEFEKKYADDFEFIHLEPSTYELLLMARYVISGATTAILESISAGNVTFVLDVHPKTMPHQVRDYPDLCQPSIESIIQRIEAIEAGTWSYPRHLYKGLVAFEGANVFDIIREDMGLEVIAESPPEGAESEMKRKLDSMESG